MLTKEQREALLSIARTCIAWHQFEETGDEQCAGYEQADFCNALRRLGFEPISTEEYDALISVSERKMLDTVNTVIECEGYASSDADFENSMREPPAGTYAATARAMAQLFPNGDVDWDAWKDEMKENDG